MANTSGEDCSMTAFKASVDNATFLHYTIISYMHTLPETEKIILIVIRVTLICFGLPGNITLLAKIFRNKISQMRPFDLMLINMTVMQILKVFFSDVIIADLFYTGGRWHLGEAFCIFYLFFGGAPIQLILFSHAGLAIDRIIKVGFSATPKYKPITVRKTIIFIVLFWVVGFLWSCRLITTNKYYTFSFGNCSFHLCDYDIHDITTSVEIYLAFEFTVLMIPIIIIFVLNVLLVKLLSSLRQRASLTAAGSGSSKEMRAIKSILFSGTVILVSFIAFWSFFMYTIYSPTAPIPFLAHLGYVFMSANIAITPWVYASTYPSLWKKNRVQTSVSGNKAAKSTLKAVKGVKGSAGTVNTAIASPDVVQTSSSVASAVN